MGVGDAGSAPASEASAMDAEYTTISVRCTRMYKRKLRAYCKARRMSFPCYLDVVIAEDMARRGDEALPGRMGLAGAGEKKEAGK